MAEELCVEERGEHRRPLRIESALERIAHELDKMLGVDQGPGQRLFGIIGLLQRHVGLCDRHLPVLMAARPALFVEVEIIAVGRITGVAAPDLQASLRVAGKDGDRMRCRCRPVHDVGAVDRLEVAFPF